MDWGLFRCSEGGASGRLEAENFSEGRRSENRGPRRGLVSGRGRREPGLCESVRQLPEELISLLLKLARRIWRRRVEDMVKGDSDQVFVGVRNFGESFGSDEFVKRSKRKVKYF